MIVLDQPCRTPQPFPSPVSPVRMARQMKLAPFWFAAGLLSVVLFGCEKEPGSPPLQFRQMTVGDFCSAMKVYKDPNPESLVGFLGEESTNYTDPISGERLVAIHLRASVNGRLASLWRSRDELLTWYVTTPEPYPDGCKWVSRADPPFFGRYEILASAKLARVGPGEWRSDRVYDAFASSR